MKHEFETILGAVKRKGAVLMPLLLLVLSLAIAPQVLAQDDYVSSLEPADTSSPRATLKTFRENFERAFREFYKFNEFDYVDSASEQRAVRTLDTRSLPPVQRDRLASEAIILLNEVLDKVKLPPYEQIPDAAAMRELPAGEPRRWQIPNTEISIERIEDGPRAGEYLFSSATVGRLHEFYKRAQNMSYQPGVMEDIYERIVTMGGNMMPEELVASLPGWAKVNLVGQAAWKWVAMVVVIGLWILIVYALRRLGNPRDGEPHYWLRFVLTLALLPITRFMRWIFDEQLILAGTVFEVVDSCIVILIYVIGAVAILNLASALASTVNASSRFQEKGIDSNLVTVGFGALGWLIAIGLLARGASDLGVPLAAVITSLGVGGFAFAMAARPTLENLIAGVTLYLDKPVKVGEFCQFDDVLGTVERIGLRSTRIRRWGGHVLSIPNSQFAEYRLDNYNDARYIWIRQKLRLRYETSADQLKFIIAKLREMLFAHPKILLPRVRLIGFGDDALTVEILAYSDTGVWAEWHAIREDVFLRVMEIVEASGTRLALPSQTTYFARDDGVDEDKKRAAEAEVREWTEKGELPFPDMSEAQREALDGTLEFPPSGSVGHRAIERSESAKG